MRRGKADPGVYHFELIAHKHRQAEKGGRDHSAVLASEVSADAKSAFF